MGKSRIVSVMAYPEYNNYRIQVARTGGKVNSYMTSYEDVPKVLRLVELAAKLNMLVMIDVIKHRRKEHGYG